MSESVIIAIITGLCAVIGQWLISRKNRQDDAIKQAKRDQHLDDTIKSLSDRVDEHNKYAKMFSDITADIRLIAQDVRYLKEGKL